MKPQKVILIFFMIAGLLAISLLIIRLVVGGPEDAWLCQNGQWVAHGVPKNPMPSTPCQSNSYPHKSPKTIVEAFYRWYANSKGNEYQNHNELSEGLKQKIAELKKNANVDPVFMSQDVPSELTFNEVFRSNDIARVEVTEKFGASSKLVEVTVAIQNGRWQITDINEISVSEPVTQTKSVVLYYSNAFRAQNSTDCSLVFGVERELPSDVTPTEILTALVAGPTATEKQQGYNSFFSQQTVGKVKSVIVKNTTAYVNLFDLRTTTPNASSSCGSQQLLTQMNKTLKQDPKIKDICYAIDSDPKAFYEWLQLSTPQNCKAINFK